MEEENTVQERYFLEKDRIAVFIGHNGEKKKEFEEKFNIEIEVDSKSGEVIVEGEPLTLFVMQNIIAAINYGHNPDNAMKLEDESYVFDIIDVKILVKDHIKLKKVLGRVIGKEGSTRKVMEDLTNCSVSVKDHFVSVIGPYENTLVVHDALKMLIQGASHKTFYSYLERNRSAIDTGLL